MTTYLPIRHAIRCICLLLWRVWSIDSTSYVLVRECIIPFDREPLIFLSLTKLNYPWYLYAMALDRWWFFGSSQSASWRQPLVSTRTPTWFHHIASGAQWVKECTDVSALEKPCILWPGLDINSRCTSSSYVFSKDILSNSLRTVSNWNRDFSSGYTYGMKHG